MKAEECGVTEERNQGKFRPCRRSFAAVVAVALACSVIQAVGQVAAPQFSIASGVYTNEAVTFTVSAPSGTVRYTMDGSVPGETSLLYGGPITVGTNVVIKARAFGDGGAASDVVSRTLHFLDASAQGFTSALPILIASTSGQAIRENIRPGELRVPGSLIVINTVRGRSSISGEPEFIGLAEFEYYGQTASGFPKKPFMIEVQDEFRNDRNVPLLGLPAESDWRLRTLYNDKTFLNEYLSFDIFDDMGRYTPRRRFVEVFVDTSGGRIRYPQDYVGIMILMEKIEQGANRVPIAKLKPSDNAEPAITGGYIFKKEKDSVGDLNFATGRQNLKLHEPKPREVTTNQIAWLRSYIMEFERTLYAENWLTATGVNHYSHYIDVDSFVDQHWITEFTKNIDGYRLGNFMQKDRGGKIKMDLLWDWELSLGNADYLDGGHTNGWFWIQLSDTDHIWLHRLIFGQSGSASNWRSLGAGDPDFIQRIIDRWGFLRTNALSPERILTRIDELAGQLGDAVGRDFAKYPRLGVYLWPNPGGPPTWDVDFMRPTNHAGILAELKKFVSGRHAWIDSQLVPAPFLNSPGGKVAPGFELEMAAPAGTIHYTLDGTDPRLPGGGIAPQARMYTAPVGIHSNVHVFARVRLDTSHYGWSPPARLPLHVEVPRLRITEVMFQPASLPPVGVYSAGQFEFVELANVGSEALSLAGFRLGGDVSFTFNSGTLQPNQRVLVVRNRAAFESRYGGTLPVAGEFSGTLSDAAGHLTLTGSMGEPIQDFTYQGDWYPATRGHGFSLVIVDEFAPVESWGLSSNWRTSPFVGGSPGGGEDEPAPPLSVVVNELLPVANASGSAVELRNLSSAEVSIAGWYITDDFEQPKKFRVPSGVTIPANGYHFVNGADLLAGATLQGPPSFSPAGGACFVFSANPVTGELTGYVQGFEYGPQTDGVSLGRVVTSVGEELFVTERVSTPGSQNSGPRVGLLAIGEIMYQPRLVAANGSLWDNTEFEFIELVNTTGTPLALADAANPQGRWRLGVGDGVEFEFLPGTVVPPGGRLLIVGFDPSASSAIKTQFLEHYGLPANTPLAGPFPQTLANASGVLTLYRSDAAGAGEQTLRWVLMERVRYASISPWPLAAGGSGHSLQRRNLDAFSDDVVNWTAASPTPDSAPAAGTAPIILTQPQGRIAGTGTSISLSAEAAGPGPIFYQWRRNEANVPSGTNATLIISPVRQADGGSYQVVAMNPFGAIESAPAVLTVVRGVELIIQPFDQAIRGGSNATFAVAASSSTPIRFQWRLHGTNLPGATNAMLVVPNVDDDDAGPYSVVCTDDYGSIASQPAELVALTLPTLTGPVPPLHLVAVPGETLTLGVSLRGKLPIYCRWRIFRPGSSGQVLATQILTQRVATLNIPVNLNSAGAYTVIMTNEAGGSLGVAFTNAIVTLAGDADGDLLPDDYETANGLLPGDPSDAATDTDDDGLSNREEYLAGTDPRDGASFLKLEGGIISGRVALQFGAIAQKNYTIQFMDELQPGSGPWTKLADVVARTTNRVESVTDALSTTGRYYRVVTPIQP
jgi:hypothetical protein